MPAFATQRQVPYTPADMFALIADIEKYPEFVPLCEALRIRKKYTDQRGHEILIADMTCGYKAIRESFISRVKLDPANNKILVEYIDGPFRYLENTWSFTPRPNGCTVSFDIKYEFKSPMLGLLVGGLFDRAFRKFTGAFEARAKEIYGCTVQNRSPYGDTTQKSVRFSDLASQ